VPPSKITNRYFEQLTPITVDSATGTFTLPLGVNEVRTMLLLLLLLLLALLLVLLLTFPLAHVRCGR